MVTKAMIFAAGLGTRLKPFTDHHPKALAIVNGKTLLQRNVEYLQLHGINNVVVNVHHFAKQIIDIIELNKGWGSSVEISDETAEVLETGGGLQNAATFLKEQESFVVMNADILTDLDLTQMINQHETSKPLATLAVTNRESSRYFLFDSDNRLSGWKNTKTNEEKIVRPNVELNAKAFSGIHVISSNIFSLIKQQGKFSMVDVYLSLAAAHIIQSYDHTSSKFIDVGKPENINKAETLFI